MISPPEHDIGDEIYVVHTTNQCVNELIFYNSENTNQIEIQKVKIRYIELVITEFEPGELSCIWNYYIHFDEDIHKCDFYCGEFIFKTLNEAVEHLSNKDNILDDILEHFDITIESVNDCLEGKAEHINI